LADAAAPVRARRILLALAPVLLVASAGVWWLRFQRRPENPSLPLPPPAPLSVRPAPPSPANAAPPPSPSGAAAPTPSPGAPSSLGAPSSPGAAPVRLSPASSPSPDDKTHAGKTHHHALAAVEPAPPVSAAAATAPSPASTSPSLPSPSAPVAAPAADAPATLSVAIAPWCDLAVDGKPRGRTPQTLTLPPGQHHLECKNPVSGQTLQRDLELAPGESRALRERLYATVRVTAQLTRGDALSVDGDAPAAAPRQVAPGRRRVTLFSAGKELETRYIDVPPDGCRIVDKPEVKCEKP
jgi:hypothetical protein